MFHFPSFPPHTLCVQVWVTAHDDCRVSPFGNPRIKAWLTAPRGLSWPPTSFIGSWCQGIHRAPLKTWPQMLASTVQFSNNDQPPVTHHIRGAVPGPATEGQTHTSPYLQIPNSVPDPTECSMLSTPKQYSQRNNLSCRVVNVPPMSNHRRTFADEMVSGFLAESRCSLERR